MLKYNVIILLMGVNLGSEATRYNAVKVIDNAFSLNEKLLSIPIKQNSVLNKYSVILQRILVNKDLSKS